MVYGLIIISKTFEGFIVIAPVVANFDEQFQKHFFLNKCFYVFSGFDTNALNGLAFVSDNDGFLGFSHNEYRRVYTDEGFAWVFFEAIHDDFARIRNFLFIM